MLSRSVEPSLVEVPTRDIRWGAQRILDNIDETLQDFNFVKDRGRILQRVFNHASSSTNLLNTSFHLGSHGRIHSNIVSGLKQSLSEVKVPRTAAQLGTKHAILTAVVSGSSSSFLRGQANLLDVHPRKYCSSISS